MADELNIPTHRWYQRRNHVALAPNEVSRQLIKEAGLRRIDAHIMNRNGYGVGGVAPNFLSDFAAEEYYTDTIQSSFSDAITHTRAGNAMMVDSDGVLKWAPHNLLTYSEEFDQWINARINIEDTSYGSITGAKLTQQSGQTTAGVVQQQGFTGEGEWTLSVIAKVGENREFIRLNEFNAATSNTRATWFNLTSGSAATTDTGHTASTVDLGDGWFLCSISFQIRSGNNNFGFFVCESDNSLTVTDNQGYLYVAAPRIYRSDLGGMVNNPDRGDSYVPTTSSAVYLPRRGHHVWNGSAWVNEGLLHESEARTNLIPGSETIEQKDVYVTDQDYTLSFKSGTNIRSEISETLGVTAVDVFVYDTTKDSDGGAWRTGALAQASSWYNETLNTSTRGARREFPQVAVIVAEAGKVTIYDGDDPDLPMWMVFEASANNPVFATPSSIVMLNATLAVGTSGGVSVINFISDGAEKQTTGTDEAYQDGLAVEGAGWV